MKLNRWQQLTGKTVHEWSEEIGQHPETIRCRLVKHGTPYPDLKPIKFLRRDKHVTLEPKTEFKPEIDIIDPKLQIYRYSDDTPLEMVNDNLSSRALNCLKELDIVFIGDLRKVNIMRVDSMHNYGVVTRNELIEKFFK
tara:strand:- start:1437 stop:1853 length:417 start_codon:yes stop_codon:yes gene_type:complete